MSLGQLIIIAISVVVAGNSSILKKTDTGLNIEKTKDSHHDSLIDNGIKY